ncbi:tetratricopeptide repeat protein [Microbispora sp. NPDC049125]|uniref:tetratricopeptide repeat protein n=1 Tax=Microbispora sp. NPDC049125 TaxID=3154929 RepID=UPI0034677B3D
MGSDAEGWDATPVPPPLDNGDPRAWCAVAVARLARDQPEAALDAARQAVGRDPQGEWGHRLVSVALERLGRDSEAVASAREAVRHSPGSWAARLRLGSALRRRPGGWREAWAEARAAVRFAPEEPDPHVLVGDLALLRGDHDSAARAYAAALRRRPDHPAARVNLGLTLLRWDRPRPHHDPAWEVDPRETGQARRALESWSRQVRVLLAAALTAASAAGPGFGLHREAQAGGALALAGVVAVTVRQAGRVRAWPYVPAMLGRDLWLALSVALGFVATAAYVVCLATLPATRPASFQEAADEAGGAWAGAAGLVLLNAAAPLVARLFVEAWRGRPIQALAQFAAALPDRTAVRDVDVASWVVAGRVWQGAVAVALLPPLTGRPVTALASIAVLGAVWRARTRAARRGAPPLRPVLRADRWLAVAVSALAAALACLAVVGAAGTLPGGDPGAGAVVWAAWAALTLSAAAFAGRAARAWWRGGPGPWRASLVPSESHGTRLPGDSTPSTGLSDEVRHAATYSRSVVLAYTEPGGPRALAVSAVTSVTSSGEFRLIAGDEAWDAVERDPRVVLFVSDPRFWAEVRGVAVAEGDVLRVTPRQVLMREYPGRHQARTR